MKFRCACGEVIRDQTDHLPHKARYVADEDWFDLNNVIEDMIREGSTDPDALTGRTLGYWREMHQCPACGRLYLEAEGQLHAFAPEEPSPSKNLMAGSRSRLFRDQNWAAFTTAQERTHWETELRREIVPGHALFGRAIHLIARRTDRDDVIAEVGAVGYALVHPTWTGQAETPPWPRTTTYPDLRSLCAALA